MRQVVRALLFLVAGAAAVMVLDRLAGAAHGDAAPTSGLELCATPEGQVMLAGASGCGPGTTSAGVVAHQQSAKDAFAHIAALESRVASLEDDNAALASRVSSLESDNASLASRMTTLEDTFAGVTRTGSVLKFEGMNLQVVNGTDTTASSNGTGNIIIGYNTQRRTPAERSGSHYLVVGDRHEWTGFGGIVAGFRNTASGSWASVSGGFDNWAAGDRSSISGGRSNLAVGEYSSVSGGFDNHTSGFDSSISGGNSNVTWGERSSVSGGFNNSASGIESSVSGGNSNDASGERSSVSGGSSNYALGERSSVSGGHLNGASGRESSVGGGERNFASGDRSSVTGGYFRAVFGLYDWRAGNAFQDQ